MYYSSGNRKGNIEETKPITANKASMDSYSSRARDLVLNHTTPCRDEEPAESVASPRQRHRSDSRSNRRDQMGTVHMNDPSVEQLAGGRLPESPLKKRTRRQRLVSRGGAPLTDGEGVSALKGQLTENKEDR